MITWLTWLTLTGCLQLGAGYERKQLNWKNSLQLAHRVKHARWYLAHPVANDRRCDRIEIIENLSVHEYVGVGGSFCCFPCSILTGRRNKSISCVDNNNLAWASLGKSWRKTNYAAQTQNADQFRRIGHCNLLGRHFFFSLAEIVVFVAFFCVTTRVGH